ncbi:MAG: hypothetical protein R2698_00435 [Microthrixaceae bacterium]
MDDDADLLSALPSVRARVIAFAGILVCGALGAAIGFWYSEIACRSSCTTQQGLTMLGATVLGALGAASVATISLRVVGEWRR